MSKVAIRAMQVPDLSAILEIQSSSKEAAQWSQAAYEKLLDACSSELALVAERASSVMGFIVARQVANELEILNLAVAGVARRQGVGRALLQDVLTHAAARGAHKVFLEVRASNFAAQDFYQAQGFAIAGRRANYYTSPVEDALLLARSLSELSGKINRDPSWPRTEKCDSFCACDTHSKGGADAFDGSGNSRGPDVE